MTKLRSEVMPPLERRRRWSREEKERIVTASLEPGAVASVVARTSGIHVSQLFRWRKDLCERVGTGATQLIPVEVVSDLATTSVAIAPPAPPHRGGRSGIIEIELDGDRRVRVDRDVDAKALRRVLDVLGCR